VKTLIIFLHEVSNPHSFSTILPEHLHPLSTSYKGGQGVEKGWTNRGEWVEIATVVWLLSLFFSAFLGGLTKTDVFGSIEGFVFPLLLSG
jgi:hypothetical protein